MNEPKRGSPYQPDATGTSYGTQVNAGIAAFRRLGFKHRLLIEWRGWSNMGGFDAHELASVPCRSAACSLDRAGGLKDPIGRTMLSGHRYPDQWSSGTEAACITTKTGAQLLANAEAGARQRNLKVWVGEFAFGNARGVTTACRTIGKAVIQQLRTVPEVYAGISWWGGGSALSTRLNQREAPSLRPPTARTSR
jgi:endoglucanase